MCLFEKHFSRSEWEHFVLLALQSHYDCVEEELFAANLLSASDS